MDAANRFDTKATYRLVRLEYLVALGVSLFFFIDHIGQISWWQFAVLFVYIDLIGYLPGAIAYHRSRTKRIPKAYYVLYNTMHSLVTQAAVAFLLGEVLGVRWALLALPIHLFGDRSLFGNFLKPFSVSFEPVRHPAFRRLEADLGGAPAGAAPAPPVAVPAP